MVQALSSHPRRRGSPFLLSENRTDHLLGEWTTHERSCIGEVSVSPKRGMPRGTATDLLEPALWVIHHPLRTKCLADMLSWSTSRIVSRRPRCSVHLPPKAPSTLLDDCENLCDLILPDPRTSPCEDRGKMKTRSCARKMRENKERRTVGMGKFHETRPPRLFYQLRPLNNSLQAFCFKKPRLQPPQSAKRVRCAAKIPTVFCNFFLCDLVLFGLAQSIPPQLCGSPSFPSSARLRTIPANVPVSLNEA